MNKPAYNLMSLLILLWPVELWAQAKQPPAPQAGLQKQVEELRQEVQNLRQRLSRLNLDVIRLRAAQDAYKTVELDPASPRKYQRIDSDTGSFLISVEEAEPYLDGYKVQLEIGNPSSASYSGFSVTVRWGKKYDWDKFDAASHEKWEKSIREKEISFTNSLVPGMWNRVELILTPTKADELGFLEVSIKTDTISFRR